MNRISQGQFTALLLITDVFTMFCLMGSISLLTTAGFIVGIVLQYVMALPVMMFYKKGGTLKNSGKPAALFYLLYLFFWGGLLFVMLWNASEVIYIPYENVSFIPEKILISGIIAVTCLYASSPGIKAISRAAVIAAALGAVCILVVIIGALPDIKTEYLFNMTYSNSFLEELSRGFVLSGGLGSFVVLLGFTKGSVMKNASFYFIGKAILYAAVTIVATAVVGGVMKIVQFPVVTAAELSQPFTSQRIDALFLIILVIFAVFAIAVQVVAASYLLNQIFPSFSKFRSTFALLIMIGAAFLISGINQYHIIYAAITMIAILIVPLLMILTSAAKKKGRG